MGTVPTDRMEDELRAYYVLWAERIAELTTGDRDDLMFRFEVFKDHSQEIIKKRGGKAARAGVAADFPAPKELELSTHTDTVYDELALAVIRAGLYTGVNARETATALFRAELDPKFSNLERLARTETVSAYWKNQWDEAEDLDLIMVWSPEHGSRTCDVCLGRDGLVVKSKTIRDHPNGRCTLLPTLPQDLDYKGTLLSDGSVTYDPILANMAKRNNKITARLSKLSKKQGTGLPPNLVPTKQPTMPAAESFAEFKYEQLNEARRWVDDNMVADTEYSARERKSIRQYTTAYYTVLNGGLRYPDRPLSDTDWLYITAIDSAMERSPIKQDITLHRVADTSAFGGITDLTKLAGRQFDDKGYLSTAIVPDTFMGNNGSDVNMRINVPAGSKALWVDPMSDAQGEMEVLLPRDSRFDVKTVEEVNGKWLMEMDLIE